MPDSASNVKHGSVAILGVFVAGRSAIENADVFFTQLEQPLDAAEHARGIARNEVEATIALSR